MDTVHVAGLRKSYGNVEALRGLDAVFPSGAVGLLGPNGAGKSTLLKILLGLVKADGGTAHVLEIDAAVDPLEVRRRVGYMPEQDAYLAGLTGAEAVLFAGVLCGLPRRVAQSRAHDILHYVGLEEARYRRVEQYSTGMRQRLRMAQALVHDPGLVFLDEPTNGLDPDGRDEVLELIRDLTQRHRKTVVLCSHLLHDVEAVCEHVVVLRRGALALSGAIGDIRKLETGTFRVRIHGEEQRFRDAVGRSGATFGERAGEFLVLRMPEGTGPREIFRAAHETGAVVRALSSLEQSLEGIFLRAVQETV